MSVSVDEYDTVVEVVWSATSSPKDDVLDAVQEAYRIMYARPRSFDDNDHRRGWLIVVARRELWRQKTTASDHVDYRCAPDAGYEMVETLDAIRRLQPRLGRALLAAGLGLHREETASALGLTVRQIDRDRRRARAQLV